MLSATEEHGLAPARRDDIQIGDEITYDGTLRSFVVRATDTAGISHTGGRVSWDAPGLRKVDALTPALDTPLTPDERQELQTLEEVVHECKDAFVRAGTALGEIRSRGLYRETHRTFEAYAWERFGLARSTAYQQMTNAAEYRRLEERHVFMPANEAVTRELVKVPRCARDLVWRYCLGRFGEKPTAAQVKTTFEELRRQKVTDWDQDDLAAVLGLEPGFGHTLAIAEIEERLEALGLHEAAIKQNAAFVKQEEPGPAANLTSVEQEPECPQIADTPEQLSVPETEQVPAVDYQGWTFGDAAEWDDPGTGDLRRGVVNSLWNGMVVVLPTDGKPPKNGIPMAPEKLRPPEQLTSTEIIQEARGEAPTVKSAPVKSAAQIAAERAAARTTKPGVLKSVEEKVAEKHAPKEPAPPPPGWDGKPVMALIPPALAGRLDQTGAIPVQAVTTYCDLWDLTTKHQVEPEAAVELLDRFLSYCQRLGRSPESVLGEADEYIQDREAGDEA